MLRLRYNLQTHKKNHTLAALVFASALSAAFSSPVFAQPSWLSTTPEELHRKARDHGTADIILKVDLPGFQPDGELPPAAAEKQRAAIHQAQDRLLERMASYKIAAIRKFQYIPYVAMTVDTVALAALAAQPGVLAIEENVPTTPVLEQSTVLVGANTAWSAGFTGTNQTIAILDTGVDSDHPFLIGKTVAEACFSGHAGTGISDSLCPGGASTSYGAGSGQPCGLAECDHGTHVAGIAAGRNSTFSGVARDANIITIQVFSGVRPGSSPSCPDDGPFIEIPCLLSGTTDQLSAMEYIYSLRNQHRIAAVNLSVGGGRYTSPCDGGYAAAVSTLRSAGIATVAAAGNNGWADALTTPGCTTGAISVGSTTKADGVSSYSNSASFMTFWSPGESIKSSVPGAGYAYFDGTSMATPHVAGAWAVLKSRASSATVDEILTALKATGVNITDPRNGYTKRRIRVDQALSVLVTQPPGISIPWPVLSSEQTYNISWGASSGNVTHYELQESNDSDFSSANTVYSGPSLSTARPNYCVTMYYRVRACNASLCSAYRPGAKPVSGCWSTPIPKPPL